MSPDWLALNSLSFLDSLVFLATHAWPLFIAAGIAGLVDSIGGGGGLITMPTLLNLGVPAPLLLGSNKCVSTIGSLPAVLRYRRAKLLPQLPWAHWIRLFIGAALCATLGAWLSQQKVILDNLHFMVPILLFAVMGFMLKRWFWDERQRQCAANLGPADIDAVHPIEVALKRTWARIGIAGIAFYDGIFGPGTGTFFLSLFEVLGLKTISANAITKIFNLASNVGAIAWFGFNGKVLWPLGFAGAFFYLCGNYIGAGLVLRRGQGLVRIVVLLATSGLLIKHLLRYV
ncbi:MAG TPA: TSUP family transporter [Oligoflexus sp.]|uniref:TSUP family transporter n=1 Tax=Oligoflexus sp. TaxID=1971216 RepID=UPI002D345F06|nr:TSUP family transporter [Oligoflexus sp.]HYX37614.1 TSUP family transporter [Oligoflexus sp.]